MPRAPDSVVAAFTSQYDGKNYIFNIRFRDLDSFPPCMPNEANPPLSPREAITLAMAYLPHLIAEAPAWRFSQLGLKTIWDDEKWIYTVCFLGVYPPGVFDGPVSHMTLIVLMNGCVIEPDISPYSRELSGDAIGP